MTNTMVLGFLRGFNGYSADIEIPDPTEPKAAS
jgi:hypothetical protein